MCCFKCNLVKHFAWDHTNFNSRNYINIDMDSDQVYFSLFNEQQFSLFHWTMINDSNIKIFNLEMETLNRAVLDSVCSQTFAGEIWFEIFFDTLSDRVKQLVETAKFNRAFCFGDGEEIKTIKTVKFPVTLGGIKGVWVEADITKNDLSLLLNHKSMKTAEMKLNFKNDSFRIFDRYIELQRTTSGHYSLPLTNMLLGAGKKK